MTILLFQKTPRPEDLTPEQRTFLEGTLSALSYLEAIAFKENMPVLRAGLRFAQISVERQIEEGINENLQAELQLILDKTISKTI